MLSCRFRLLLRFGVVGGSLKIEKDARLVAGDPSIVARRDKSRVARVECMFGTVIHSAHHGSGDHIPEMRNLAGVGTHDWLYALGPFPPRFECATHCRSITKIKYLNIGLWHFTF